MTTVVAMEPPAARLEAVLRSTGPALVAMSAGVDSTVLAYEARRVLGGAAWAVTVRAESSSDHEIEEAVAFAKGTGLEHHVLDHSELADPDYVRNDVMRCFHCRKNMASVLRDEAARRGATVLMGYTVSDFGEWRPGYDAAKRAGVRFPFVEAGLTKEDVRQIARERGLDVSDKPSNACLSSRIPYGSPVTMDALRRVEAAEDGLRRLGFDAVRVRHHGRLGRIEVPVADIPRLLEHAGAARQAVLAAGFDEAALDLDGYRPGSLNEQGAPRVRAL